MIARTIRHSLAVVIWMVCPASPLFAQFGLLELPEGGDRRIETVRQERGGAIIIQWSEAMDELSGFSNKTGRWQKLKIEPQEAVQPNCVEFVGAVRLKNAMAAYSGETGTWDVVTLPETSTAQPAVSPDVAQFKEGEHFYAFAASTGRWTSPTDPALKPFVINYPPIKHITASEMHEKLLDWMQTVPAAEVGGSIQLLNGTLSLLPRTKTWLAAAQAEIARIDVPKPDDDTKDEFLQRRHDAAGDIGGKSVREGSGPTLNLIGRQPEITASLESQVETLRRELTGLENAVESSVRSTKAADGDDALQPSNLRTLVERSFDLRQQLQELEARRMRLKLEQIENNLAIRAQSRETLIERRLEELQKQDTNDELRSRRAR